MRGLMTRPTSHVSAREPTCNDESSSVLAEVAILEFGGDDSIDLKEAERLDMPGADRLALPQSQTGSRHCMCRHETERF